MKGFKLTPQVLDRLVLAENQLVYGMVIEVLFSFLRGDICNLLLQLSCSILKFFLLDVLSLEVAFELRQDKHVVRFNHALEAEAHLGLEADEVVKDRCKVGI